MKFNISLTTFPTLNAFVQRGKCRIKVIRLIFFIELNDCYTIFSLVKIRSINKLKFRTNKEIALLSS